jgi:hypothetical protein
MPEDNNQQNTNSTNQQNGDSTGQQNGDNQNQISGSNQIILGCDHNNGEDQAYQDGVEQVLTNAGYIVEKTPIGPNAFASYSYSDQAKGKQGVFLIAAGLTAIVDAWYGNISFDYCVFGIRQHLNGIDSQADMSTKPISADRHGDCLPVEECNKLVGHTYDEINEITKNKCVSVTGGSPEEMGQNILAALGGQTGSAGGSVSTGGSAQIKDKTFEHCIRRICAATDSVFLVENNAAVLFPYVDWMAFTLRHKISQIKAKDMDPDLFEIDYNTDGFYNKVTVVWGGEEVEDVNPNKDKDKDKDKKNEQEEEKETIGNVTTLQKRMPTGGTQLSEQYDPLVNIYGELEKKVTTNFPNEETAHFVMNALLIQYIRDFNNSCRCRVINNQKIVGGTFYAVENPITNESELFYLNSYTMFKSKDQPLVTDIEFKYGPEGAEELLDYQSFGGGGGSTSGGASGDADVPAEVKQLVAQVCQGITDPMQKMIAIHNYLKDKITYDYHCCRRYAGPKECLAHMGDLNCADTTTLTVACMLAAGLDAVAVKGDFHFWTVITINGKEYASDAVSAYHDIGDVWQPSGTSHFNDGGPYFNKEGKMPKCTEEQSPC